MDYEMNIKIIIDALAKKNTFRDALITQLTNGISSGNVLSYNINIKGVINKAEDYEAYNS